MTLTGIQPPLAVEIEIGSRCNRRCSYCPNSRLERPEQGEMSEVLFRLLLDQLSEIGFRGRLSFHFYNEPLLSENLENFVALAKTRLPACKIKIYTNGTLLNEGRLRDLFQAGVDEFTVTKHEDADLISFENAYARLPDADRRRIQYKPADELILSNRGGLLPHIRGNGATPPLELPCFVPKSGPVVTLLGNVVPCFEDYLQKNAMGNISERHFGEIWQSERYIDFRESLKQGKRAVHPVCRKCNNRLVLA